MDGERASIVAAVECNVPCHKVKRLPAAIATAAVCVLLSGCWGVGHDPVITASDADAIP